ncbi:MAG: DUF72 domain-containing protein [Candidatus Bathyarchaeia archaeon]|jgi:uncharacterized protein YecE (DUF72 family)
MQNLHLGTIGWSYNFWRGNFYPNRTASKDFLAYYASKFSSVEVDSTFYRIPKEQALANWKEQTPAGFIFSLKFPGVITHIKMLEDCQRETELFLDRTKILKEKLGPLLLQFPPSFGKGHLSSLAVFLDKLPKVHRYVIEVRDEELLNDAFYSLLKDNNVALAWVNNPSMPSISEVTSDFLYVRWEGDRKKIKGNLGKIEVSVQENLRLWANKIKPYLSKQIDVFGYFGKYYSGYPPSDINLLFNLLS